jgi:hypothetical protein
VCGAREERTSAVLYLRRLRTLWPVGKKMLLAGCCNCNNKTVRSQVAVLVCDCNADDGLSP